MPDVDLSGYTVEFFQVPLFGTWSWRITTDNRMLGPTLTITFADREKAESAALRRMEQDAARESMTGPELAAKRRRA